VKRIPGRLKVVRPGLAATRRRTTRADYVLIVDDGAAFTRLLKTELATIGLETLRVADAAAAQQLLEKTSPSAIVLDLRSVGLPTSQADSAQPAPIAEAHSRYLS
jgi:response regulator RpfG family c-di-GMP phosphodiesterase